MTHHDAQQILSALRFISLVIAVIGLAIVIALTRSQP